MYTEYLGGCGEIYDSDADPAPDLSEGLHSAPGLPESGRVPASYGVLLLYRAPAQVPAGQGHLVDLCTLKHPQR